MSLLLDTCLISELIAKRPNLQILQWLEDQDSRSLYLSVITFQTEFCQLTLKQCDAGAS